MSCGGAAFETLLVEPPVHFRFSLLFPAPVPSNDHLNPDKTNSGTALIKLDILMS
jgi:hypothetical protein